MHEIFIYKLLTTTAAATTYLDVHNGDGTSLLGGVHVRPAVFLEPC